MRVPFQIKPANPRPGTGRSLGFVLGPNEDTHQISREWSGKIDACPSAPAA